MTSVISKDELVRTSASWKFEGYLHDDAPLSFFLVEAPPGTGPDLHVHPYQEIFILEAGQATMTVGDETIEVRAGHIVVAPANTPHKFVSSGTEPLRTVNIHPSPRMITTWLRE